jgi:hypothetical protein
VPFFILLSSFTTTSPSFGVTFFSCLDGGANIAGVLEVVAWEAGARRWGGGIGNPGGTDNGSPLGPRGIGGMGSGSPLGPRGGRNGGMGIDWPFGPSTG